MLQKMSARLYGSSHSVPVERRSQFRVHRVSAPSVLTAWRQEIVIPREPAPYREGTQGRAGKKAP